MGNGAFRLTTCGSIFPQATGILRVSQEVEDAGMDDSKHGGAHSDYKVEQLVKSGNLESGPTHAPRGIH